MIGEQEGTVVPGLPVSLPDSVPVPTDGALTIGVEEEFHVIDVETRELTARAGEVLDRLPAGPFTAELHRSVVEAKTEVCRDLTEIRAAAERARDDIAIPMLVPIETTWPSIAHGAPTVWMTRSARWATSA